MVPAKDQLIRVCKGGQRWEKRKGIPTHWPQWKAPGKQQKLAACEG